MPKKVTQKTNPEISSTFAKSNDGTIQITFVIPHKTIQENKQSALKEIGKSVEIHGFRKGMAPIEKVGEKVSAQVLTEKILNAILPSELTVAFTKYNIKPAIYPKLELLSNKEGEDWQVRITTCELPEVELGNYKKEVGDIGKSQAIWTPERAKAETASVKDSGDSKQKEKLTPAEKEQAVVRTILATTKVNIPKPLIEEEVNSRLAKLLEQIDKLGLSLESYLASIGKDVASLRKENERQAQDSLIIELALNKIAVTEKVEVSEADIDSAINASTTADPKLAEKLNTPEQRKVINAILRRRQALSLLTGLIS